MSKSSELSKLILEAHAKSFQKAFEIAVRTGTALVYSHNGKIIERHPPYQYKLVAIKPSKRRRKNNS
ncbi:MAG TPA: hypothetical protein VLG76_05525 [Rhabdochlamydiaceae bacterium]|nr:hypothetical protein [Rhabdochlamydiaceae bacterium]